MKKLLGLLNTIQSQIEEHKDSLSDEDLSYMHSVLSQAHSLFSPQTEERNIPKGSEILWLLAGENPKAFTAYMRSFPNQQFNEFSQSRQNMNWLTSQFKNRITPPVGESEGGVPKSDLQSSNIYGFQYDPGQQMLKVRFQGGAEYVYDDVPPYVFKMFQRGAIPAKTDGQNQYGVWWKGKQPSLGASFHELIRDHFPYQKVA